MAANVHDAIMLFGDSITQGAWEPDTNGVGQLLTHVYARKLDVLNRGLSGYNTDWAIPVFEKFFATTEQQKDVPRVRLLTVWFGANDACIQPSPQHVPLARFIDNLKHIVNMVKSPDSAYYSPTTHIILITPPPVNTYQRGADLASRDPPLALDRLFSVTQEYAYAVKSVGEELGTGVLDVWTSVWEAAGKNEHALDEYLRDGLHLNKAGYKIAYDGLMELISQRYPDILPDNLAFVFQPWAELDWENYRSSFVR